MTNLKTVDSYIAEQTEERAVVLNKFRKIALESLPEGFSEGIIYNMIGYYVSLENYPAGYHVKANTPLPFINIASQKNFVALYHMGLYANKELHDWFVTEYPKHCKYKLDMGKSCIRFKKMEDIPFKLIAELFNKMTVKDWISLYEKNIKKN